MGYNISEVTGFDGGVSDWTLTVDLADPSVTTVTGDFDVVGLTSGDSLGEADTYAISSFGANFGTYTNNFVLNGDGTFSFDIDRAAVIASGTDQTVSFTIVGSTGGDSDDDTVTVTLLICVARGTHVRTGNGNSCVEDLQPGDWVVTRDADLQQIKWIGSRYLSQDVLRDNPNLRPIRIESGALGSGLPTRDLIVSPQHRVLLTDWRAQLFLGQDETLLPAKGMINNENIYIDWQQNNVEYFHILFDRHQIIYTEDQATESFHPADYTLGAIDAEIRAELAILFPDLMQDNTAYGPTIHHVSRIWEARVMAGTRVH